jgi:hypothetical protein
MTEFNICDRDYSPQRLKSLVSGFLIKTLLTLASHHTHTKINSKFIVDLNIVSKTIKFLEQKKGKSL